MNARRKAIKALRAAGFQLVRHGGKHDQFRNEQTHTTIPLKRHDFDESDLRYILKEIEVDSGRNLKEIEAGSGRKGMS